jgi:hypothetical protein
VGIHFIPYWVQYPDSCVVIPANAGIQNLDASVRWHDKYLTACGEDYLLLGDDTYVLLGS